MQEQIPQQEPQAKPRRGIRSFVCRSGRMTDGQAQAYQRLWPIYGILPQAELLDFGRLYGNAQPVVLEIGFGMGQSLANMAMTHPDLNYLGVEVHKPGVGSLLAEIAAHELTNIRVVHGDAVALLEKYIPNESLAGVQIFFPDPWHKTRHHKRRLIQAEFIQLLHQKLHLGGFIHLATDWRDYAVHMQRVFAANNGFVNQGGEDGFMPNRLDRPATKFERRGELLGHGVWDLYYKKID